MCKKHQGNRVTYALGAEARGKCSTLFGCLKKFKHTRLGIKTYSSLFLGHFLLFMLKTNLSLFSLKFSLVFYIFILLLLFSVSLGNLNLKLVLIRIELIFIPWKEIVLAFIRKDPYLVIWRYFILFDFILLHLCFSIYYFAIYFYLCIPRCLPSAFYYFLSYFKTNSKTKLDYSLL